MESKNLVLIILYLALHTKFTNKKEFFSPMEQACVARPRIGSKSLKRIYALVSFLHVKNILL